MPGRASVGKLLARHLGKTFYDSDQVIESRTGVKIPVIFELEGEAGFRAREAAVIEEFTALENVVLATGGGAVLAAAQSRAAPRPAERWSTSRASVNELWSRTRHDRNRPLLQTADPLRRLCELHAQRDPLYREVAAHNDRDRHSEPQELGGQARAAARAAWDTSAPPAQTGA